ncbi:MAG: CDP-alcohol phosphatidyltransferase family protein [Ruminococcaceae bacterium]|nr:CDP-alcohol phosphatidyltransferase family protein [Oscillospiraceae bacterium]
MSEQISLEKRIWTIPNVLSLLRLAMIPLFVWLYCGAENSVLTAMVLVLSGLTDVADGFIARHYGMVSDLGKILDPLADKLTQAAMLMCLITRFPLMLGVFLLLALKEIFAGVCSVLVIRWTGTVLGSEWHGKLSTVLLHGMIVAHVVWQDIPGAVSNGMIAVCTGMMLVTCVLYGIRNLRVLQAGRQDI